MPRDSRQDAGATQTSQELLLKAIAIPYNRAHHRFAVFAASRDIFCSSLPERW